MRPGSLRRSADHGPDTPGQSLPEFALILPVLLLLVLVAIDFGRIFVGWIAVNQMARVGANYAAGHPGDWPPPPPAVNPPEYVTLLQTSADDLNCSLVALAAPEFESPKDVGGDVTARVACDFAVLTPIISTIVGSTVRVAADSTFPILYGCLADCPPPPAEGTPPPPPDNCRRLPDVIGMSAAGARAAWIAAGFIEANFNAPASSETLTVSGYVIAPAPDAEPCTDPGDEFFANSITVDVEPQGEPTSDTCVWVPNLIGVSVAEARSTWTAAGFTGAFTPDAGSDASVVVSQTTTPAAAPGACIEPDAAVQVAYDEPPGSPPAAPCKVPSFVNTNTAQAPAAWSAAGFTGTLSYKQNPPFIVKSQSLVGGTYVSCSAAIVLSRSAA